MINFHAPGSGSAFPIRIRIQDSQMNAEPGGSGSTTVTTLAETIKYLCGILVTTVLFMPKKEAIPDYVPYTTTCEQQPE
jgi:hypothetical protein